MGVEAVIADIRKRGRGDAHEAARPRAERTANARIFFPFTRRRAAPRVPLAPYQMRFEIRKGNARAGNKNVCVLCTLESFVSSKCTTKVIISDSFLMEVGKEGEVPLSFTNNMVEILSV